MRRTSLLSIVAAALAVGTAACVPPGGPGPAPGGGNSKTDCATRSRRTVAASPSSASSPTARSSASATATPPPATIGSVTGLDQDTSLVGIDYRPANDVLYGVGNAGGVYTIDADDGRRRRSSAGSTSRCRAPSFGVDFNPTVDRLRIVSDTGQNLRVNVDDGTTTVDGTLNIPGATPVNPALGVTAVAYTNNDADPNTATTLFDIDTTNDNAVIQAPPNAGSLSPTGKLGVDAAGAVGFDIYSQLALRHDRRSAPVGLDRHGRRVDEPVPASTCWPAGPARSARSTCRSSTSPSRLRSAERRDPPTGSSTARPGRRTPS